MSLLEYVTAQIICSNYWYLPTHLTEDSEREVDREKQRQRGTEREGFPVSDIAVYCEVATQSNQVIYNGSCVVA